MNTEKNKKKPKTPINALMQNWSAEVKIKQGCGGKFVKTTVTYSVLCQIEKTKRQMNHLKRD